MCDISTDVFPHPFVAKSSLERLRKWFFGRGGSPKRWGDLHVSAWLQNTLAEGGGFELIVDLPIPRDCNYLDPLIDQLASAWYYFAAILIIYCIVAVYGGHTYPAVLAYSDYRTTNASTR